MRYSFAGISFINSLPFFYGRHSDIFDFSFGTPAELNSFALQQKFDVSMISRWAYPACSQEYEVLPNFCIGGDGDIVSIKLFSNFDISKIDNGSIFITSLTGTTSRALRRLCLDKFGFDIFTLPRASIDKADSVLLIGDNAMLFDGSRFVNCYDFGALWKDYAKCKMLYAVFVIRRSLYKNLANKVADFLDESLKLFAETPQPVFERAFEMSGRKLSLETIKAYYPHLIFKMSQSDFKKSFDFVKDYESV